MDLLLQLSERLNDIEQVLENALKDKQGESTSQPPKVIRIVSKIVPSTLGIVLAPNIPSATIKVVTGTKTTGTTLGSSANLSTEALIKAMEDMKLQVSELKHEKEQLAKMERDYDISKINIVEKTKEIKALENKVKTLENDLTFDKPLAEIKKILWANITQSINDVWSSIQVIFKQIDLVKAAEGDIQKIRPLLGQMLDEADLLINFLNNRNK